jgi:glucan phosphoethanolaminetransferase (alkaline phosphatase superfamily)
MSKKIILFAYLFLITIISLWPANWMPNTNLFPFADKLIHALIYAIFTFLLLITWPIKFRGIKQIIPFIFILSWGFFMEVMQYYTNLGRIFDLSDELANCLGFFPGWLFWKWIDPLS